MAAGSPRRAPRGFKVVNGFNDLKARAASAMGGALAGLMLAAMPGTLVLAQGRFGSQAPTAASETAASPGAKLRV